MGKLVDSTIMHDPHLEFTRELAWLVYKRLIKICMVGAASGDSKEIKRKEERTYWVQVDVVACRRVACACAWTQMVMDVVRVKKKERDKKLTECRWWTQLRVEVLHVHMVSMQMLGWVRMRVKKYEK